MWKSLFLLSWKKQWTLYYEAGSLLVSESQDVMTCTEFKPRVSTTPTTYSMSIFCKKKEKKIETKSISPEPFMALSYYENSIPMTPCLKPTLVLPVIIFPPSLSKLFKILLSLQTKRKNKECWALRFLTYKVLDSYSGAGTCY